MSALLAFINCMIGQHDPKRRYVKLEGREYVGECRHCGKSIQRVSHRDWRVRRA